MTTREFLVSGWQFEPIGVAICAVATAAWATLLIRQRDRLRTHAILPSPELHADQAVSGCPGERGIRAAARPISAFNFQRGSFVWLLVGAVGLFVTTTSPLQTLANGYLFSAHTGQHLLLLLIVPLFFLMALPQGKDLEVPARTTAGRLLRVVTHPVPGWLAGLGGMWLWHEPNLCSAAATNPLVHGVQVATLLGLGVLFWWPIVGPQPGRRISVPAGIGYLFSACVGCTLLGILITFSPVSVCPAFLHHAEDPLLSLVREQWGFTPAFDQQVGGLLMWVPACLIYLSAIVTLLVRWFSASESAAPRPYRPLGTREK